MENHCFQQLLSVCGFAIEVATALYKAGAPLEIHNAAKLLRILKEKDHVKLIPYTFHDYMGHHEEGTVYQLPWEYECMDSEENVLSLKQYHDISLWQNGMK